MKYKERASYLKELEIELFDLVSKVNFLLDYHSLRDSDGCYTFPDGDVWDSSWLLNKEETNDAV